MHHGLNSVETILRFRNHFYHELTCLQYFEGCPRMSSFHLINLDHEVGNE